MWETLTGGLKRGRREPLFVLGLASALAASAVWTAQVARILPRGDEASAWLVGVECALVLAWLWGAGLQCWSGLLARDHPGRASVLMAGLALQLLGALPQGFLMALGGGWR